MLHQWDCGDLNGRVSFLPLSKNLDSSLYSSGRAPGAAPKPSFWTEAWWTRGRQTVETQVTSASCCPSTPLITCEYSRYMTHVQHDRGKATRF